MKRNNISCIEILKKILMEGSITRPKLVQWSGMRPATVFSIIDLLKANGLVCEPARTGKHTGRRASEILPSGERMWTAGIDFQVHGTTGVVLDMTGTIRYQATVPAGSRSSLASCRKEIESVLAMLRRSAGPDWKKVEGIGFADPGLVDIATGISLCAVNVPGWKNVNTGEWFNEGGHLKTGAWPECYVKTYMEYERHFHNEPGSLFLLELDNGVGGGFFKNGVGFVGDTSQAMEIGHIIVDPKGPLCQCGNRGCLEAFVGEKGIRRRIEEAVHNGVNTALSIGDFSFQQFIRCAQYDKTAWNIAAEISENTGRALAVIVALLNPSIIVLSGELTGLGELLTGPVQRILNLSCFVEAVRNIRIEISGLQENDTARGAALLVREKLINSLEGPDA